VWLRAGAIVGPLAALPWLVPSLRFQLAHAFVDRPGAWSLVGAVGAVAAAVGVQVLFWSPWVLRAGGARLRELDARARPLAAAVALMSGLVVASALARATPPEPNWWAPGAVLAVAAAGATATSNRARVAAIVWWLAPTALAASHTLHAWLPLDRAHDPSARLHGWSHPTSAPLDAPGVGPYGPAAEACVYGGDCDEISSKFNHMQANNQMN
jgi:hypothetical protein